ALFCSALAAGTIVMLTTLPLVALVPVGLLLGIFPANTKGIRATKMTFGGLRPETPMKLESLRCAPRFSMRWCLLLALGCAPKTHDVVIAPQQPMNIATNDQEEQCTDCRLTVVFQNAIGSALRVNKVEIMIDEATVYLGTSDRIGEQGMLVV